MESWCLSKHKSRLLYWLFIFLLSSTFIVQPVQGAICIEEERKAILEIKASLLDSYTYDKYWSYSSNKLLPTWVDLDHDGECCEWERVKCDSTSGHVTHLSLTNMLLLPTYKYYDSFYLYSDSFTNGWLLNFSLFLHFEELRSLDLSYNSIVSTEFEMVSSLKKLELLNLSHNQIQNDLFPSLSALTTLKILDLGYNRRGQGYHDISEFAGLENLELLDLTRCGYHGTVQMEGFERDSILKKLKILNLRYNQFNKSLMTSLRSLPTLKVLDLSGNGFSGLFPAEDLSHLTKLEKLDLSVNELQGTPSVQGCKSLSRLKRLESILLAENNFNKSIISCLSFLPLLNTLDLSSSLPGSSFPMQELLSLRDHLQVLLLSGNEFNGTLPMEGLASLHNLEVLDLSINNFSGSIPSTIQSLSSLRAISFTHNMLNGSLPPDHGLCELKNLQELDLSGNMFDGNLPECFNRLSSLKLFDISSNQFTGTLPSYLITNLTSLEYVDFSYNKFRGLFSFSSFSNLTKLEVVIFKSENNMFEVETEEPIGWIPMFQLKVLVLSNCNMNRRKGSVSPSFLLYQNELTALDMSHNSLKGQLPIWLIENNTRLESLILRNNSLCGSIQIPFYRNANRLHLDISANFLNGTIPRDMQTQFPNIVHLNLSSNSLDGAIPSSFGNLSELYLLDLSHNELSAEVPTGLLANHPTWLALKLSNNRLGGQVLSGNLSLGVINRLHLDSNCFTGKIANEITKIGTFPSINLLDISNNFFTGNIPDWISNLSSLSQLMLRNNMFQGKFSCGGALISFLDISENSFSGSIPSCVNWMYVEHLHLGSNRFTGSIPTFFRNFTKLLTLDIRNNNLSGRIPKFLGDLYSLRIFLLGKNKFIGSIPIQLCQLNNANLIDLSSNSLSGSIPSCLHNISVPRDLAFHITSAQSDIDGPAYSYKRVIDAFSSISSIYIQSDTQDEVLFTTKSMSRPYKGNILDYMSGLDLSGNKLTGEIPSQLGMLTQIRALNLSHNQLTGPIPVSFSNLRDIESLDLSLNCLSGNVPSELIKLNSLAVFNVSHNNLSGRLPEMKAQFSTFGKDSYQGNPSLCGPPLDNICTSASEVIDRATEEGQDEKWCEIDMTSFYGSCGSTWFVFMLGFSAILYINPYWRRRWLDLIEECMYTCYYFFFYDCVRKVSMFFYNEDTRG